MSQVTELLIRIKQQGDQQLTRLQSSVKSLAQQTSAANVNFKELSSELRKVQATSTQSINNLRGYANTWREIANSVDVASNEFKQANAEAAKLEAQLKRLQPGNAGRFKGIAQGVGTVAAAGVFGGPLGAAGALAGAPFGVAGMAAGGAIGAQAGMMGQQVAGLASYTAELDKQRLALKLVTQDGISYQQGLAFINQTSRDLAIPQELITRQFTQLSASVLGAGGNIQDAEKAFLGIAAGIRGTGGSLEDLDGALRATAQVFSKGKVSAEELRQQIGERLPGAFTLFAKAIDKTPQQLDKALEDGSVSLQDFLRFTQKLLDEYGENSKIIASGPESAGDRLKTALSRLSESVGRLLKPIGAAFQSIFADIVNSIDGATRTLARFFGIKFYDPTRIKELTTDISRLKKEIDALPGGKGRTARENLLLLKEQELVAQKALAPAGGGPARPSNLPGAGAEGGGGGKSVLNKLQTDFAQSVAVLGRQFNNQARRALLNDVLAYEEKITQALKKGNIGEADRLKIMQQRRALEITRDVLINEETSLENKILDGKQKGLDLTGAQIRLDAIRLEREQAVADIRKLDNQQLREAAEFVRKMNEDAPRYGEQGAEPITIFGKMKEEIEALKDSFVDIQPRLTALADGLATSFSTAFSNLVFSTQSARESLAQLFGDIAKSFQNMVMQMITDYLKLQIMTFFRNIFAPSPVSVAGNFFGGGASSTFTNPQFGVGTGSFGGSFLPSFAMGGIMTGSGPLKLRRYAAGGIASSPQLAMFGEGSRPEAYVPLPDGRTIPVTMKNGGGGVSVNVNVDASGSNVEGDGAQASQLGKVIGLAVQQELIKQKRPGGLLA